MSTTAWDKANPERRAAINAAWRKTNPERAKAFRDAYRKANPNAWEKAHPDKRNALTAKHRASKLQRTPPWADHDKINEWYELAAVATKVSGVPHEVDHIIPLRGKDVSGLHIHTNMQVLTEEANRKKRNTFAGGH